MKKMMNVTSDKLNTMILVVVFIIMASMLMLWFFNFLALSETNMYVGENKYIDVSLGDVEGNYKNTFILKDKLNSLLLNVSDWFMSIYGIFGIIFFSIFLFTFLVSKKDSIISMIRETFER